MIGAKQDLPRAVSYDVAESMANSLGMEYFEVSSKFSSVDIDVALESLSKNIRGRSN